MITLNLIQQFLEPRKMAIAGVSRDPKKFGGSVFNELKKKGFQLFPINPNVDEIYGEKCYKSVADLPADVKHLYIVTPKSETAGIVGQAVEKGIQMIWIQQKSEAEEALKIAIENSIPLIWKKCIFMFADPVLGGHKFHRSIVRFFGGYPKLESVR